MNEGEKEQYVIVDKDGVPLFDVLEIDGIVILSDEYEAADCIVYLIEDSMKWARYGLRVERYDPSKHVLPEERSDDRWT